MEEKDPKLNQHKQEETANWGVLQALLLTAFLFFFNPAFALLLILPEVGLELTDSVIHSFMTIAVFEVITVLVIYYFVKTKNNTLKALKLRVPKLKDLFQGATAFIPYFILTIAAMSALKLLFPEINFDQEQQIGFESATSTLDLTLTFVALAILVPISEELLFRGVLLQGFLKRFSPRIAIFVSSVLFGLAHMQLNVSIDTFIFGLFLGTVVVMTKNIWPAILLHSIKNSLAFVALFLFP